MIFKYAEKYYYEYFLIIVGIAKVLTILFLVFICLKGTCCSSSHINYLKERAESKWEEQGFEVVAYEGYQFGPRVPFTTYGGAFVWHRLRKVPDNGITYSGHLYRWGEEIHVYGPRAHEAIEPRR
jgi:hypothetical protein